MKIIHCSDLHLDSKMQANLDTNKAKERRNEILLTYKKMVQYAKENDVRIILIAGDLFDKKEITIKTKNTVLGTIKENENIDFLILKGNHDEGSFIEDLEQIPPNVKFFNKDKWTKYQYGKIVIAGLEFGEKDDYEIYNTLMLNKNDINIVMLHGQESNYNQKDKTEIINLQNLKNKNIDYLALGHIHKFKKENLDYRGIYCYSGCLEGRGFDECGDKGFVLLNIDEEKSLIDSQFIPFAQRKLYEIKVDVTGVLSTTDVEKNIDNCLSKIEEQALIKIILTGNVKIESEIDISFLEKKYKSIYYFAKIYDETKLEVNYMDYENDLSLKGEFIRLVLKQNLSTEDTKSIIETGIKALSGEEVG